MIIKKGKNKDENNGTREISKKERKMSRLISFFSSGWNGTENFQDFRSKEEEEEENVENQRKE